ncbi:hypothetical protein BGZ76_002930 [Entomortierella beljakovae]|nr:hypothetical protein BGZ76_002930 [Entomortierella beljakovae]
MEAVLIVGSNSVVVEGGDVHYETVDDDGDDVVGWDAGAGTGGDVVVAVVAAVVDSDILEKNTVYHHVDTVQGAVVDGYGGVVAVAVVDGPVGVG